MRYFSSGSCEEFLLFETDMRQVFKGQGVNIGPGRFDIAACCLLTGGAHTTFNQALVGAMETVESCKLCMNAVCESIFPGETHENGHMRKPKGLTIQQFADQIMELNLHLTCFPPISSTRVAEEIPPEGIVEILDSAIPCSVSPVTLNDGVDVRERVANT
jgi:hypothetical protein